MEWQHQQKTKTMGQVVDFAQQRQHWTLFDVVPQKDPYLCSRYSREYSSWPPQWRENQLQNTWQRCLCQQHVHRCHSTSKAAYVAHRTELLIVNFFQFRQNLSEPDYCIAKQKNKIMLIEIFFFKKRTTCKNINQVLIVFIYKQFF